MILDAEQAKSSLITIPIAADAIEAGSAVVKGVRQNPNFGFG
jgi:hypothetical protein